MTNDGTMRFRCSGGNTAQENEVREGGIVGEKAKVINFFSFSCLGVGGKDLMRILAGFGFVTICSSNEFRSTNELNLIQLFVWHN